MRKLLLPLIFSSLLFGFDIGDQTTAQTPQNDPNIITVQAPESFELEAVNGKKCIPKNFFCPEIKFRKINKTSNAVLKEWYLEYDQKNISNIDYQSGNYTCTYSSNDVIEFSHNFTNKFCSEELKTQKDALKDGEQLLGYDFQRLRSDIDSIPETDALDLKSLANQASLPLNFAEYESKGFLNLSELRGAGLTLDTDYIKGTDSKMNLLLNSSGTSRNAQAFSSGNIETVPVTIYSDGSTVQNQTSSQGTSLFFGKVDPNQKSFYQQTKELLGISTEEDTADEVRNEALAGIGSISDFLDMKNIGYYIELVFAYNDVLSMILLYLAGGAIVYKLSHYGWASVQSFLMKYKNGDPQASRGFHKYIAVVVMGGVFFFLPVGEYLIINNQPTQYKSSASQSIIQYLVKEGNKYADLFFNNGLVVSLRYLTSSTNTYSKPQLDTMTDQIANELIVTQRQIDFMQQQCRPAYGVYNDTFVKSKTDYLLNKNYTLYSYGVPTASVCKNTESSIYFNLKNIQSSSELLEHKISSHQKYNGLSPIEKSMKAISANQMIVARDFGWNQASLLYLSNEHFSNIGLYLDTNKKAQIENAASTYFNKNQITEGIEGKDIIDNSADKIVGGTSLVVESVSEFAFMNIIPGYAETVSMYKNLMTGDKKDEDKGIVESVIKKVKDEFMSKVGFGYMSAIFNTVVDTGTTFLALVMAKITILAALESMKSELIKIFINLKTLYYYLDVMLLYFFSAVVYIYVALISEGRTQKVEFAISKLLYIVIYPSMIVFSSALIFIAENFARNMLRSTQAVSLETTKLITSIGMSSADFTDKVTAGFKAAIKMGMSSAINEVLLVLILVYVGYKVIYSGPEMTLRLFNADNIGSDTHKFADEIMNKIQNKVGH